MRVARLAVFATRGYGAEMTTQQPADRTNPPHRGVVRARRRTPSPREGLSSWIALQIPAAAVLAAEGWLPTDLVRAFNEAAIAAGFPKATAAIARSTIGRRAFAVPLDPGDPHQLQDMRARLEVGGARRKSGYYLAARAEALVAELAHRISLGEFRDAVYRDMAERLASASGLIITRDAVREAIRVAAARPPSSTAPKASAPARSAVSEPAPAVSLTPLVFPVSDAVSDVAQDDADEAVRARVRAKLKNDLQFAKSLARAGENL